VAPSAAIVQTQRSPEDEALIAVDDDAIIRKAMSAQNGAKFRSLFAGDHDYPSGSEADLALCSILAYWTDGHPSDVDRLFRQSALFREKWDEQRGAQTYGEITVGRACESYVQRRADAAAANTGHPDLAEWMTSSYKNDAGNAERIRALFGRDMLFSRLERSWLVWDGCRWVSDPGGRVYRLAKLTMAEFLRQAVESGNGDQERFARDSLNDNRIKAALNSLRAEVEVDPKDMDSHPLLLNFMNGTVDLETGILREHRREDRITKLVHCDYDATATAPTFQKVMQHVTGGAQTVLSYLQQVFGYALTGKTGEKAFWVFYGPSGTGKTTVLNAIRNTFSEYSTSLQIETLMADRSSGLSNNQQSDLADLRGARFAQTSEVESGQRLKEGLIKRLTQGTGLIKAARKFQEQVQFAETHKLFIDANHRPEIKDGVGVWERLHCVPFLRVVPAKEQDQDVHAKLEAEGAGIAAWVVAGALAWLQAGRLVKPAEVLAAGSDYQESQDVMGEWIAESCELGPQMSGVCSRLLESYNHHVGEFGGRSLDARRFKERLLSRGGITDKRRKDARIYEGIGLKQEFGNAHVV
jgi:putative DNA primase/helicase